MSLLAIIASFAVAPEASAQTTTPDISAPRTNDRARIRQEKRATKSDGVVTCDERQDIRQDERQTKRAIYRQKYDGQGRLPRTVLR